MFCIKGKSDGPLCPVEPPPKFCSDRTAAEKNEHADERTNRRDEPIVHFLFVYMQVCKNAH